MVALAWAAPIAQRLGTHLPGTPADLDVASMVWNVAWVQRAIETPATLLRSDAILVPFGADLTAHTYGLFPAALVWPVAHRVRRADRLQRDAARHAGPQRLARLRVVSRPGRLPRRGDGRRGGAHAERAGARSVPRRPPDLRGDLGDVRRPDRDAAPARAADRRVDDRARRRARRGALHRSADPAIHRDLDRLDRDLARGLGTRHRWAPCRRAGRRDRDGRGAVSADRVSGVRRQRAAGSRSGRSGALLVPMVGLSRAVDRAARGGRVRAGDRRPSPACSCSGAIRGCACGGSARWCCSCWRSARR